MGQRFVRTGLVLAAALLAQSQAGAAVYICLQYPIWQNEENGHWVYFAHRHSDEADCWTYDYVYYEYPTDDQFDGCFNTPAGDCRPEDPPMRVSSNLRLVNLLQPMTNPIKYKLKKKIKPKLGKALPLQEIKGKNPKRPALFVRFVKFKKGGTELYAKIFYFYVKGKKNCKDKDDKPVVRPPRFGSVGFQIEYDENIKFSEAKLKAGELTDPSVLVELDGGYSAVLLAQPDATARQQQ